jgi:outer membrane protein OmpA-like peptidoglycan-associated protein
MNLLASISFASGSYEIDPFLFPQLDQVAAKAEQTPGIVLELRGYTDNVGSISYNQVLSDNRAQSVEAYLVGKNVSASQMVAGGFGENDPIADNSTEMGRAENRRVEIYQREQT